MGLAASQGVAATNCLRVIMNAMSGSVGGLMPIGKRLPAKREARRWFECQSFVAAVG
jgi:hypothetical protein